MFQLVKIGNTSCGIRQGNTLKLGSMDDIRDHMISTLGVDPVEIIYAYHEFIQNDCNYADFGLNRTCISIMKVDVEDFLIKNLGVAAS